MPCTTGARRTTRPIRRCHDRGGHTLDPHATFTLASDRDDMADFLDAAGYLFVRDVFRADEVAAFLDEAQQLRRAGAPGRQAVVVGQERGRRGDRVPGDPRHSPSRTWGRCRPKRALHGLKDLADPSLVYRRGEGEGVTVIYKHPHMAEGLGDLPWHRDCGMGGHAVICPVLLASVYLTAATPETGELAMLPGSHRAAMNAHDQSSELSAQAAHFRAQPGDVSVHFSDTVHVAPPPTDGQRDGYRISAVVGFARPEARHHRGEGSYNDVLHQRDDGQIERLDTVARRA